MECEVWRRAAEVYGPALKEELAELLGSYRRTPGFDRTIRLFQSCLGPDAFAQLCDALQDARNRALSFHHGDTYLEMRHRLHVHIFRGLQRLIVQHGLSTEVMAADFLAYEIGS